MVENLPKILVVLGPTASGKSALAIELAERFQGEIVACDSLQIYRELNIGTAKPSFEDRVRVKHHLIDICGLTESFDASLYIQEADKAIASIITRGKLPIVCGGSMLYAKALLRGVAAIPPVPEECLKAAGDLLQQMGMTGLLGLMEKKKLLEGFIYRDPQRVLRAYSVYLATGRPIQHFQQQHQFQGKRYDALLVATALLREVLYSRINARTEKMLQAGWIEEVQAVLERFSANIKPLQSIGYAEIVLYLRGQLRKEVLAPLIAQKTRHYAKRQLTWWRREPSIHWFATWAAAEDSLLQRFFQTSP